MLRTVRYMARYVFLATTAMVGMFSIVCFFLAMLGGSEDGLFARYYMMSPILGVFCLIFFSLSTNNYYANAALSMSCTRREYFWGSQIVLLLNALLLTVIVAVSLCLPDWFQTAEWLSAPMSFAGLPLLFGAACFIQELTALLGGFATRRRWLMVVSFFISILVLGGGTVLYMLWRTGEMELPAFTLPALLGASAVMGGLSWLPLAKYTVR